MRVVLRTIIGRFNQIQLTLRWLNGNMTLSIFKMNKKFLYNFFLKPKDWARFKIIIFFNLLIIDTSISNNPVSSHILLVVWNYYAHSSTLDSQPKQATRMTHYVISYKLKHMLVVGARKHVVARSFAIYGDAFPLDAHSPQHVDVCCCSTFLRRFIQPNWAENRQPCAVAVNSQYVLLYSWIKSFSKLVVCRSWLQV